MHVYKLTVFFVVMILLCISYLAQAEEDTRCVYLRKQAKEYSASLVELTTISPIEEKNIKEIAEREYKLAKGRFISGEEMLSRKDFEISSVASVNMIDVLKKRLVDKNYSATSGRVFEFQSISKGRDITYDYFSKGYYLTIYELIERRKSVRYLMFNKDGIVERVWLQVSAPGSSYDFCYTPDGKLAVFHEGTGSASLKEVRFDADGKMIEYLMMLE